MQSKKISEELEDKSFTISVEFVPPRNGTDLDNFYKEIERIKGKINFASVTKGAGGSLRGGTLPISYHIQNSFGVDTAAHFVCRERTSPEIENDLMDLHHFGIRNILALRGDPPAGSDEKWSGDYKYAYLLVEQIRRMNEGIYLPTSTMKDKYREGFKTDFCILVAGHPEDDFKDESKHMQSKVDAGAEVIITQMMFSFNEYKVYVENLRDAGINLPVISGIRPLTDYKQAESVEKYFGLNVDDSLKKGLEGVDGKKSRDFGIKHFIDMISQLKDYGCPGVHLFTLNDVSLVDEIIDRI